eukprot:4037299-Amphidinium_carterae.1
MMILDRPAVWTSQRCGSYFGALTPDQHRERLGGGDFNPQGNGLVMINNSGYFHAVFQDDKRWETHTQVC